MPRDNLARHHDELVDDQDRETHADHLRGVDAADEDLAQALDDAALVDGDSDPDKEGTVAETLTVGQFFVELGVKVRDPFIDVFVEHQAEDRSHGIHGRVADEQPVAVKSIGFVMRGDAVDGLADGDDEAAVDDELGQLGGPLVRVPAMPDEQLREMVEAGYGEVGGEGSLTAFLANDADTYVGGLNHGDVVAAVADAGDAFLGELADQVSHVGFLRGRTAAGDDSG